MDGVAWIGLGWVGLDWVVLCCLSLLSLALATGTQLVDHLLYVVDLRVPTVCYPIQVLEQGSWLAEYYVGAKKTFYSVEFSPNFHGMTFHDAVVYIFELFEVKVNTLSRPKFFLVA